MDRNCSEKGKGIPDNPICIIAGYETWNRKVKFGKESRAYHQRSLRLNEEFELRSEVDRITRIFKKGIIRFTFTASTSCSGCRLLSK